MSNKKISERRYTKIEIDSIEVSRENVRTEKQRKNLEELKTSIKRVGLIHPVVVIKEGKKYELLAGQRRLEAFRQLKETEIPAIIINDVGE